MRVLIAGAGIGGLTAALAALRLGHEVEVYEQASELREVGAGVQLVSRQEQPTYETPATATPAGAWHAVAEGLRWTVRHPAVRTLSLTILIFNVTFGGDHLRSHARGHVVAAGGGRFCIPGRHSDHVRGHRIRMAVNV